MNIDDLIKQLNDAVTQVAEEAVANESALVEYTQGKALVLYEMLDNPGADSLLSATMLTSRLIKLTLKSFEQQIGQPIPRALRVQALQATEGVWFKEAMAFIERKKAYTAARMIAEGQQ